MTDLTGTGLAEFLGATLLVMGAAAWLTGQAVASTWRPAWMVVLYCLLLGGVDRFLIWGLFGGSFLSPGGFATDAAVLTAIGLVAFRLTRVARMVRQYPWLYQRSGWFSYRKKGADE